MITGRKKELIIRGGENISPLEIETCIMQLSQVENVKVFAIEDTKYQEEICACVILKNDALLTSQNIKCHVSKHLAEHKCPRYVLLLKEFPYTASGKVCLNELKRKVKTRLIFN